MPYLRTTFDVNTKMHVWRKLSGNQQVLRNYILTPNHYLRHQPELENNLGRSAQSQLWSYCSYLSSQSKALFQFLVFASWKQSAV